MKCIKYFLTEYLCMKSPQTYTFDVVETIDFYSGYS